MSRNLSAISGFGFSKSTEKLKAWGQCGGKIVIATTFLNGLNIRRAIGNRYTLRILEQAHSVLIGKDMTWTMSKIFSEVTHR